MDQRKTVLITGGSRGIGAASAGLFAAKGYSVAINYHKSGDLAGKLVEKIVEAGGEAVCYQCDVSDSAAVKNMADEILGRYGRLDVLVNNAGIAEQKLFTDISDEDWERMFAVNVRGTFNCTRAVLSGMIGRKAGKIINISSIWGMVGASCEVHYSAAKAAVIGFTKALAKELGPSGIQVNCIAPGVVDTDMNGDLTEEDKVYLFNQTPLGRFGTAAEIAELVYFLASEKSVFLTGQVISPNGGLVI